jgi:hypothetical protein
VNGLGARALLSGVHGSHDVKSGTLEMQVERKDTGNLPALHEHERGAVGEADLLIGVLPEQPDRFKLVLSCAVNDFKYIGSVDVVGPIGGEAPARLASRVRVSSRTWLLVTSDSLRSLFHMATARLW